MGCLEATGWRAAADLDAAYVIRHWRYHDGQLVDYEIRSQRSSLTRPTPILAAHVWRERNNRRAGACLLATPKAEVNRATNFYIGRYNDAGGAIDYPFHIDRAGGTDRHEHHQRCGHRQRCGQPNTAGGVAATGAISANGNIAHCRCHDTHWQMPVPAALIISATPAPSISPMTAPTTA